MILFSQNVGDQILDELLWDMLVGVFKDFEDGYQILLYGDFLKGLLRFFFSWIQQVLNNGGWVVIEWFFLDVKGFMLVLQIGLLLQCLDFENFLSFVLIDLFQSLQVIVMVFEVDFVDDIWCCWVQCVEDIKWVMDVILEIQKVLCFFWMIVLNVKIFVD